MPTADQWFCKSGQPEAGINLRHRRKDKALVSSDEKLKFWMIKYQAPQQIKSGQCSGRVPAAVSGAKYFSIA